MKTCLLLISLLIVCSFAKGQIYEDYWKIQKQAFLADSDSECQTSLKFCDELLAIAPNHPVINYLEARLNAQIGKSEMALKYLKKAAELGYTSNIRWLNIHPMNDSAFIGLREKKAFQDIIKIMKASNEPIHESEIAFILKDKSIGTEGLTYDPIEEVFYLGSDYKIVKVDSLGNSTVFTDEANRNELGWVNGIHVDSIRRILWACSNDENRAEIFKYDLTSGKLLKKYKLSPNDNKHFNDLVIHPNGDIYISGSAIYRISHHSDTLELFLKKPIVSCNGITISDDGLEMFAATGMGICKIDINSMSFTFLTHEKDFHTYGIDGLYFAKDNLYAIQNELLTQVSKFTLNKNHEHIKNCEIFEKNTDDLRAPTTGVFVDDYFYFIADTQGKGSKKKGVVVMKTHLE